MNLRERTAEIMRTETARAALDVLLAHGYDGMTADELAKAVGISRATFFRYFGSKDEVIIAAMLEADDFFERRFREFAADTEDGLWARMRRAFEPTVLAAETNSEKLRARTRLIQSQPMLGARLRRARLPQIERLAAVLEEEGLTDIQAHAMATAAIAVLDYCWSQWARDDEASLRSILDEAFRFMGR
ncbi:MULTISPECIES: TetR family transcriptional regulator [unclassified Devosia]|uniref:TetR/AcrR family transcriptional regulator n=1 Tax=unclassified Devosia TaxID=196773 RepID=UPI00145D60EF|nr:MULTISPECIES: TetR family transcriptional regulator [unclassified Devosia]MBJ6986891.1 TetR/AcrR family transcriptional regulator [Devosia sp. MC521]QMW63918.1 TetR/AcrR family transcriptional regulator [Devosia sp. MC521]